MQNQKPGWILFIFFMLLFSGVSAFNLTKQAEISVLTCSPGDEAYSVYGHSAIRVHDPILQYDMVFNYGIFDFSSSNFVWRFAKGETDYLLGATKYRAFMSEYIHYRRSVFEQQLNLSQAEKQKIFDFLLWNAAPENRVYRYNFFFDNCATRVRDVIAQNIEGGVEYTDLASGKTFRDLISDYQQKLPWLNFGVDFLVGADADCEATLQEEMFMPDYILKHFAAARRADNGEALVAKTQVLYKAPESVLKKNVITSPFAACSFLFLLILVFSFKQFRKEKLKPVPDLILLGINSFSGLFVSWFVFYSEHPAMSPNYNLLWLFPLNFVFVLLWMKKKWRPFLRYYHLFISAWWVLFIVTGAFLPQKFHPVFFLMTGMFLIRPLLHSFLILKERKSLKQ
ncbi:Lnb N-terminal periplasmic domain-containing protein [Maribellus mangrovi]|uniref:Lnb N-terminal periplasmic domain-containing protein n=1 Tax=Maribellus mangrovi TaxID=3133146 RepID=UPI0030ED0B6B